MTDNKSINASNSTERPLIGGYYGGLYDTRSGIWHRDGASADFNANNGYDNGINPQDSLKRQVV